MEQVTRIELASSPWQGGIIAVILYLQNVTLLYQIFFNNAILFLKKFKNIVIVYIWKICYTINRGGKYE